MRTLLTLAALVLVAGCTTIPANPADMSPEQLKAIAIDKNLTGSCVIARNLSGTVAMVFVNLDKTAIKSGSMTVEPGADCKTTIYADPPGKPASAP
jgi:starvation-inducible outer membrane lipoprotein